MKFTHILNPYPSSDSHQTLTLESLAAARSFAPFEVETRAVTFEGEPIPEGWSPTTPLTRTVAELADLTPPRPLPLLRDVLERGSRGARGDFLIYTNMDIAVQPHFYTALDALIKEGAQAFVVNRRWFTSPVRDLSLLYCQLGRPHRGYDCFVFPRPVFPELDLGNLCLGIPWVGLGLFLNLRERIPSFQEFRNLHLTFHLGRDQPWEDPQWEAYRQHNRSELDGIRSRLQERGMDSSHPWLGERSQSWRQKWRAAAHRYFS